MKDRFFLDTNILVYSFDGNDPVKMQIAKDIITDGLSAGIGVISYQVVQEFLNVATKKFTIFLKHDDLLTYSKKVFFPMLKIYSSQELFENALDVKNRWKFSFYDSLIVAAALECNCKILYSEDLQDGQKVYSLEIVNPFRTE